MKVTLRASTDRFPTKPRDQARFDGYVTLHRPPHGITKTPSIFLAIARGQVGNGDASRV